MNSLTWVNKSRQINNLRTGTLRNRCTSLDGSKIYLSLLQIVHAASGVKQTHIQWLRGDFHWDMSLTTHPHPATTLRLSVIIAPLPDKP